MTDAIATIRYLTTARFGHGAAALLGEVLAELGVRRPLVVTDPGVRAVGLADAVVAGLADVTWYDRTPPNPTGEAVAEASAAFAAAGCDGVVSIGGGSSIDLAKGVALLTTHPGPLLDYAYVNGGAERITPGVQPHVAIPTTAGTGSEVGRAAMINVGGTKLDFLSPHLFPTRALCDPDLTLGLPPGLTAATGMDALTHCIETYLSPLVNPPAEAIALDGVGRAARWLATATADGAHREARWNMMMASMEGALTFQKGLGAVHAMAHPLGALDGLPLHHGTLNAILLPGVLRWNAPAVPEEKHVRLRATIGLDADADLAAWVDDLNATLGLPSSLGALGVTAERIEDVAKAAAADPANETTPRATGESDYRRLLSEAL